MDDFAIGQIKDIACLNRIFDMLKELSGGDIDQVKKFFTEKRVEWLDLTPLDLIKLGRIEGVENFLARCLHGDPIA